MKHIIKYLLLLIIFQAEVIIPISHVAAQSAEVSFQIFYDRLSPYGHWVSFPQEGYVWIPNAGYGFSPYQTNGYWVYTDYGWTWISDYPWGWAPFHYGRWDYDDEYGWYWVPDYEWAPAWVAWSSCPGYYGWAPLRPDVEIDAAITSGYYVPPEHWCYVHEEFMGRRDINRHFAPRSENLEHIRNSTMINNTFIDKSRNTTYIGGPSRTDVEKATGAPIRQLPLVARSAPGKTVTSKQVSLYQPPVKRTTAADPKPAPRLVTDLSNMKTRSGRTAIPAQPQQVPQSTPAQVPPNVTKNNPARPAAPSNFRNQRMNQAPVQQNPKVLSPPSGNNVPAKNAAPQKIQSPTVRNNNPAQQTSPSQRRIQSPPVRNNSPAQQYTPPQHNVQHYAPPQYNAPKPYTPAQPHPNPPAHQAPPPQAPPHPAPQPQAHPAPPPPSHPAPPPHAPPQQQKNPH